jgi:hypothetical protein
MVIGQCLPTFFDLKFCQGNMNNCKLLHDNPSLSQKMYGILWQTSYVVVFFVFNEFRSEVVVHFAHISGIVDHHCINFLFIAVMKKLSILAI